MPIDPNLPPDPNPEPTIPPQSLPPAVDAPVPPALSTGTNVSSTGLAPNVAAGIAALTTPIGGIVFMILEKRDRFVRFWAMQSIFFGVALIALNILLTILAHIIGFLVGLLSFIVWLGVLVIWIVMIVKSFSGKEWEIPVLGQMARQQLGKTPPSL